MHRTGLASLVRQAPTRRTDTPLITIHKPWKAELWMRSDQIVAVLPEKLQKLRGDLGTHGVGTVIALIRVAASIPKPPCERIVRTAG